MAVCLQRRRRPDHYGFNGADPQWLIDFAELFPRRATNPLEVTTVPVRCLAAAATLLQHNTRASRRRFVRGHQFGW